MMGVEVLSSGVSRKPGDPVLRARDEKLESLKAVAGKLVHDFNNFLVPQFGYVTLLKEELPSEAGGAQYLSAMEKATRRAESYIDSVLLAMRPERQFAPVNFSMDSVLAEALKHWSAESVPGRWVDVQQSLEPCAVFGDERHWRNAIGQLLTNAHYALATGGTLAVSLTRERISAEEMERLGLGTEDLCKLVVRDSGFGMAADVANRAFEPFYTTRTQIKAPGLGLTVVHSVATIHGGQVELESAEEKGTTVTVWIPVNGFANRDPSGFRNGVRPAWGEKKKVLLIEDDPLVKEVVRDWLGRIGFEVQMAADGLEAESYFIRKPSDLSLVISEVDLKSGRGEEIYARIRKGEGTWSVPWIFLAGRRRPEIPEGPDDDAPPPMVMQKPVTLRALAELVRRHAPA